MLVVTFEFTGAARGFMIMFSAARGVKKVGQYCCKLSYLVIQRLIQHCLLGNMLYLNVKYVVAT